MAVRESGIEIKINHLIELYIQVSLMNFSVVVVAYPSRNEAAFYPGSQHGLSLALRNTNKVGASALQPAQAVLHNRDLFIFLSLFFCGIPNISHD
jgi:hypothetical protein